MEYRALAHTRLAQNSAVLSLVDEFGVNLVRNHNDVLLAYDVGYLRELRVGHNAARRVVRIVENQQLRPRRYRGRDVRGIERPPVLFVRRDEKRISSFVLGVIAAATSAASSAHPFFSYVGTKTGTPPESRTSVA